MCPRTGYKLNFQPVVSSSVLLYSVFSNNEILFIDGYLLEHVSTVYILFYFWKTTSLLEWSDVFVISFTLLKMWDVIYNCVQLYFFTYCYLHFSGFTFRSSLSSVYYVVSTAYTSVMHDRLFVYVCKWVCVFLVIMSV